MADDPAFNPALIVVDVQEGFCPPSGALAVPNGRSILPTINTLLTYPFVLKIATKDWHPAGHISFASSHPGAEPFTSFATITNLENEEEKYESRLWLDHCIQGTPGAELVKDLDISKIDKILEKGQIKSVEMYSAFYPPLSSPRVGDSGLSTLLKEKGVTDVYVVGLAADYCVAATAEDAVKEGFRAVIVEEGTRAVDPGGWEGKKKELEGRGVRVVGMKGREVGRVRLNTKA
ncbi:NAD(+) salvage pathway protein [Pseudogymnoascus destructans]|uniref:nicotinamidase n=1 Tax=Pseudogymnoascus destructans TaxID=655981 RepID=A0A177A833_9PEZI|nr:NAD(+) salvage pathway protein [Pseudogymnoascus destructans]OAF58306.1 NAD(+) salvage pathway protein [Pseudogymnoascus destructans]